MHHIYTYMLTRDLMNAADNFAEERRIGSGASGDVYVARPIGDLMCMWHVRYVGSVELSFPFIWEKLQKRGKVKKKKRV